MLTSGQRQNRLLVPVESLLRDLPPVNPSEAKGRYRTCERRFQPERRIGPEPQAERWRWSRELRWDRSPSSGLATARFGGSSRKALELGPSLRLRGNSRRSLPHRESLSV